MLFCIYIVSINWVVSMSEKITLCNFRVNSKLKNDFSELCKSNHSNISNELRGFISRSVLSGRLNYDSPGLMAYGKSASHSQSSKGAAALRNVYKFTLPQILIGLHEICLKTMPPRAELNF